jgi:hypothetical protein
LEQPVKEFQPRSGIGARQRRIVAACLQGQQRGQTFALFQRFTRSTPIMGLDNSINTNESVSALSDFVMSK